MLKILLGGAAVLALSGHAVLASSVFVNGASGAACCGVEDLPYTPLPVIHQTAAPVVTHQAAPAVTYHAPAVTHQAAPAVTYQSAPVVTHQAPVYVHQPAPAVSTHEVIVNQIPAPAPIVAAPVVVPAALPPVAPQAAANGWSSRVYVGARGGLSFLRDTDSAVVLANRIFTAETDYDDPAYTISAVAGWAAKVNNNIQYRLEAEIGYQFADVDSFSAPGTGLTSSDGSGDAETIFAFANAYVDVPIFNRVNGTVGGGIGIGRVNFDDQSFSDTGVTLVDDKDTAFGFHLDAGLTYDISDQIALEALYRYMSFLDVDSTSLDGVSTDNNVNSHNVLIGARYGF